MGRGASGLNHVVKAAKARNVHLVGLTDNTGKTLIAASMHPFQVSAETYPFAATVEFLEQIGGR